MAPKSASRPIEPDTRPTKHTKTNEHSEVSAPVVENDDSLYPDSFDYTKTDIWQEMMPKCMPDSVVSLPKRFQDAWFKIRETVDKTTKEKEKRPSLCSNSKNKDGEDGPVGVNFNRLFISDCNISGFGRYYVKAEKKWYSAKGIRENTRRDLNQRVLPPMKWIIESDQYKAMPGFIDAYIKQNVCLLIVIKSVLEEFIEKIMQMPEMFAREISMFINDAVGKLYEAKEIGKPLQFWTNVDKSQDRYKQLVANMKKVLVMESEFSGLFYKDIVSFLDKFFGEFKDVTPLIQRVTDSLGTIELKDKTVGKTLYLKSTSKACDNSTVKSPDGKEVTVETPCFPKIIHFKKVHDSKNGKYVNTNVTIEPNTNLLERNRDNLKNKEIPRDKLFPIGTGDCVITGGVIIINPKADDDNPHPKLSIKMTNLTRMNVGPPIPDVTSSGYSENDCMNDFNEHEEGPTNDNPPSQPDNSNGHGSGSLFGEHDLDILGDASVILGN